MFQKLHRQMTLFCAVITSLILVALTCICLFISESSIRNNAEISFAKELNAMISQLQGQNTISLQWINQLQENNQYLLYFYDNGKPLYAQSLYSDASYDALAKKALETARLQYGMDISVTYSKILPAHKEFSMTAANGTDYYVSAGVVPKGGGSLGFLVLYSLQGLHQQISFQRLLFAAADAAAILLLTLFAWFFTGKMLVPLAQNRKKQIDFIAAASHELRAPLTVMLSGTEALSKTETAAEREHFIHMMKAEGTRMQHLIADMLFLARSDSGTFPVSLKTCQPDLLLMEAFEKYEIPARKKKLHLTLSLPDEQLPSCLCDAERIAQVFSILIDNAISYTPEGGTITLSLEPNHKRNSLCFLVSDTGSGVPDTEKERIFERFYRSDSAHTDKNHFGLGLCIAREIVVSHHGRLWVSDAPGGGAVFCMELPGRIT